MAFYYAFFPTNIFSLKNSKLKIHCQLLFCSLHQCSSKGGSQGKGPFPLKESDPINYCQAVITASVIVCLRHLGHVPNLEGGQGGVQKDWGGLLPPPQASPLLKITPWTDWSLLPLFA